MIILKNFSAAMICYTLFFSCAAQPVFAHGSHNSGFSCLDCHTSIKTMHLGGTIYTDRNGTAVQPGATIELIDARGVTLGLVSDNLGNFYRRTKYGPLTPPFKVSAHIGAGVENMIATASGNCNSSECHGPGNRIFVTPSSAGNTSHNAGQSCLQAGCHSASNKIFSLAGTIYNDTNASAPQAGATIAIEDASGRVETMASDNLGNFYTRNTSLIPPYNVTVTYAAGTTRMVSLAPGNCNAGGCHSSGRRIFITPSAVSVGAGNTGTGTGRTVSNINTSYNGRSLYETLCKSCHETGAGGALPILNAVDRGDDVNLTKNATATNRSRAGIATNMAAFSAALGWTDVKLQAIANYTYPSTLSMPAPTSQNTFPVYAHIETPVISVNTENARPIGAGNLNNNILNWQIGLPVISGSMDIIAAYQRDSGPMKYLNSNSRFVQNASVWKTVSNTKIDESITEILGASGGNLSTSGLPAGTYTLWLAVMPAGNFTAGNLSAFYCWRTTFTK